MKYIVLCVIAFVICIVIGAAISALIGRTLRKRERKLSRPAFVLLTAVIAAAVICAVFFGYLGVYYHADETALAALENDPDEADASGNGAAVTVTHEGDVWSFDGPGTRSALIFYPGAKVEAAAYAPLMRDLAERGVDCFLADMPFRMAIFGSDAASGIMTAHESDYENWFIGGHSLGGSIASSYAADHAEELTGLVLLASYPSTQIDDGLILFSAYGSEDGCLDRDAYEVSREYWPQASRVAEFVQAGGNHAQYGSYGAQRGDGTAEISPEEQREQTARLIAEVIGSAG